MHYLWRCVISLAEQPGLNDQDTRTPFRVSIVAIGITIGLSILFTVLGWGVDGLGIAQSLGAILEIAILLGILQKRSRGEILNKSFFRGFFRMLLATFITGCVAFSMTKFVPLMATDTSLVSTIPKFLLITAVSGIAYLAASYFLNIDEVKPLLAFIKKVLFRNIK